MKMEEIWEIENPKIGRARVRVLKKLPALSGRGSGDE